MAKKSIEMDFRLGVRLDGCELIRQSLNPDNNEDMEITCSENEMVITVRNLGISSLYNLIDDIVRCYEVSKKIFESRD